MQKKQAEDICYCTHCGATNKKSAVDCSECGKKMISKYRPFYDFLKKHSKEETTDVAVDTVLGLIRRFLLSHVYGIVLTVSIVAAGVATIQDMDFHIKDVTEPKTASVIKTQSENKDDSKKTKQEEQIILQDESQAESLELTEDDLYAFEHLSCNLDAFADSLRPSDSYWDQDVRYYNDASEMYAENNIENFNYNGIHEMMTEIVDFYGPNGDDWENTYELRCSLPETAVTGEACTSEIAKKLHADGYNVAECNYVLRAGTGDYDSDTYTGGTDIRRVVYKFVFVENNGNWYIAEDRLLENYSV